MLEDLIPSKVRLRWPGVTVTSTRSWLAADLNPFLAEVLKPAPPKPVKPATKHPGDK